MEHLDFILEELKLQKSDLVKVFVYGSRLYGVNNKDSDYDVCVIVKGFHGPLLNKKSPEGGIYENLVTFEELKMDVSIYELSFWQYKMNQNIVDAIGYLTIPEDSLWFSSGENFSFTVNFMKLKHQVDVFKGVHEDIAFGLLKKKNFSKARKILIHCIRCMKFGIQIAKDGFISDFKAANHQFYEIQKLEDNVESIKTWFYDQMYPLDVLFRKYVNIYKTYSPMSQVTSQNKDSQYLTKNTIKIEDEVVEIKFDPNEVQIVNYKGPMENLKRELDLDVLKNEDGSIQLSIGSSFSPRQSLIVYQCCGLVLDKDFNLICYPFKRFHPHDANQQMEIDWASAVVTEKPVGINISMYFQKEWKLSIFKGNSAINYDKHHKEQFWKLFSTFKLPEDVGLTYMFLFHPDPINPRILLVGARNLKNHEEIDDLTIFGFETPKEISCEKDFKKILKLCDEMNPLDFEGLVACDSKNLRITFKSKLYSFLENMTPFTPLNQKLSFFFDLISKTYSKESREKFVALFPQWKECYDFVLAKIIDFCDQVDKDFVKFENIKDQKEFSEEVSKLEYSFLLFAKRLSGKKSIEMINDDKISSKIKKIIF
jgi:hypothetical protein